ncbi:orphan sodium- and chloride-dependent neurotransmitter transporter NTT5-like [Tupaia chinensis]|uniref:orphan sodium- and chloride-dependent neurotransmitter transporter NTT5-like n=1 Tax=Tupaia chinensis TaxID=246437 RepID=UPI000FFB579C|nr:orphan sodium- and chloride-dependent neurotransmitter transporter NTT5-like [Tupaia chinensis]XP_027632269.1 orphan sodium- and chloride-dependent neurotransmitter transporter NTT5-like [Tupaia chinensis]
MRSVQEDEPSLAETGAAPENLPEMKTESQTSASLVTKISTETKFSESAQGSQMWHDKSPMTWSLTAWTLDTQTLATRATKAQAWETQAVEVQVRANQLKQPSVAIATAPSVLKPKPSDEEVLVKLEGLAHIEEEKSEIFFSRSVWPSKFEYILAQIGYCVRPSHLWRFAHLWLHNGGCKSEDPETWIHKELAGLRPPDALNQCSETCGGWRLGPLSRLRVRHLST